jgi:metal-responsive CopG/Arc/MetJ family transcriptional regulator
MKRWNLFLPPELLQKTKEMAAKRGVPASDLVRIALEKYLQALEKAQKMAEESKNGA